MTMLATLKQMYSEKLRSFENAIELYNAHEREFRDQCQEVHAFAECIRVRSDELVHKPLSELKCEQLTEEYGSYVRDLNTFQSASAVLRQLSDFFRQVAQPSVPLPTVIVMKNASKSRCPQQSDILCAEQTEYKVREREQMAKLRRIQNELLEMNFAMAKGLHSCDQSMKQFKSIVKSSQKKRSSSSPMIPKLWQHKKLKEEQANCGKLVHRPKELDLSDLRSSLLERSLDKK